MTGSRPYPGKFVVYPAIDLRDGKVVRLVQGDPSQETIYSDDARAVAAGWQAQGAEWVHVVNLDGAFGRASAANARALRAILSTGLKVQLGGGLRSRASLAQAIELGVSRAVIGTAAIEQPALIDWALRTYGAERIAVGLDARDGRIRLRGWVQTAPLTALEAGRRLAGQGVGWCVFTDVARDGVGGGLNLPATTALAAATGLRVIASGGAASLADVCETIRAGLPGLILGRALYEGTLMLPEALHAVAAEGVGLD
jgi:phosphoribosylformimino-5-aminoimidazole carboxamide ribotide isomerase